MRVYRVEGFRAVGDLGGLRVEGCGFRMQGLEFGA